MAETLDELGPVDWIVVEFPGPDFGKGQIAPFLEDLVNRELVRVLDMVFLRKTEDGTLETAEISDLDPSELGEVRTAEADLAMVLSEQDVMDLAETIQPGHSAAVLVWENLWAAPFGAAIRKAGGQLVASGRIPTQAVIAAFEADAEEAKGRSLTCHWQHDAGAGPPPPSAGPLSSPTGLIVAVTAVTTGGTTAATAATTAATAATDTTEPAPGSPGCA